MRLVAFVTFIAFVGVGSSTLLGSNKCTWGPSYWCSRVSRARECGAVNHCLQTVWTKQEVTATQDRNPQCDMCETVVNMARRMLKNKPVDEVMEYIHRLCFIIKDTYKTECINFVDDVDSAVKILESKMTANSICGVFMPCSGFDDKVNHNRQPETNVIVQLPVTPLKAGNICTDCVAFMTDLKNLLTDPDTEKQLIGMLKQIVCAQLASMETMCDDLVDTYVPQGLSLLAAYMDPQVTCNMAGFCGGKDTQELRHKFSDMKNFAMVVLRKMGVHVTTTAVECDVCKSLAKDIRAMIGNPAIQKRIVDFIDQDICANLGEFAELCKQAIDDNAAGVFQLIAGSLINDQVCINLGLCTSQLSTAVKMSSVECGACKAIIDILAFLEQSPSVQNTLKSFIENDVCTKLGVFEAECKNDVEAYATTVFEILKHILNANYLCGRMSLCTAAVPVPKVMSSGALCEVCETVVKEIDAVLTQKSTLTEIEGFLDSICQRFAGNLGVECKTFVDEYTPFVVDLIAGELNPATFCKTLGLCPANQSIKPILPKAVSKTIKSDGMCVMCEFLVKELAKLLKKNGTKAEVRQELVNLCGEFSVIKDECETFLNLYFDFMYDMLMKEAEVRQELDNLCGEFSAIKDECKTFVNFYFDDVYDMLTKDIDPKTVCTTIKLCSAKVTRKPALPLNSNTKKVHIVPLKNSPSPIKTFNFLDVSKSSEVCLMCEEVLTYVKEALQQPITKEAIKSALDAACGIIPQADQEMCDELVKQYTPQLIQWLEQGDDPYVICPRLHLCDKTKETMKAQRPKTEKDTNLYFRKHIFTKKCDGGPSYWCRSRRIAIKCGKEEYCNNKRNLTNMLLP